MQLLGIILNKSLWKRIIAVFRKCVLVDERGVMWIGTRFVESFR